MADRFRTVFNTTSNPVVVSDESAVIGGGEWGTIDFQQQAAKDLINAGTLVYVEEGDSVSDDAKVAFAATAKANAGGNATASDSGTNRGAAKQQGKE